MSQSPEAGKAGPLKVINLFGAPGAGKSAARSGLFWLMKVKGMSVEEVSEYAKYLVLAGRHWQLSKDQLYVMAKQHHKLLILEGQYEFAVTDSPLPLASYYSGPETPGSFHPMCMEYFNRFENLNFFLTRDVSQAGSNFEEVGRLHNREQSIRIEHEQKEFLARLGLSWIDLEIDHKSPWEILKRIDQVYPGAAPIHGPSEPLLLLDNGEVAPPPELPSPLGALGLMTQARALTERAKERVAKAFGKDPR